MNNIESHLKKFIVDTSARPYTPRDHAVWRFILRQLKSFLKTNAHPFYAEGLNKTGITIDEIPKIESISQRLTEFGWTAQPVSGFIPPAIFMEMQASNILPIASDMRSLDQVLYTPAPDVVHEAAGHAPMLAHTEYANYLKNYAQVAKKAILSFEDLEIYKTIRELSDLKSQSHVDPHTVSALETKLAQISKNLSHLSEATLLSRMNWWTAEYGLIGTLDDPKIYGAGLLSSLGESKWCLSDKVKKVPLTIDCIKYSYDITEPQPQLFVTPDFKHLSVVLDELSQQMAYRTGGSSGLTKAVQSKTVCTVELQSGLQISGQVAEFLVDENQQISFFKTTGPSQLSIHSTELPGHSSQYHAHGYSSPIGALKSFPGQCPSTLTTDQWASMSIDLNKNSKIKLEFVSGAVVQGILKSALQKNGKTLLLTLDQATAKLGDKILFQPDWGTFDLALGLSVPSVFGGPGDRKAFGQVDDFKVTQIPETKYSEFDYQLFGFYQTLRDLRAHKKTPYDLETCLRFAMQEAPEEWLLFIEILEFSKAQGFNHIEKMCLDHLHSISKNETIKSCIQDGIALSNTIYV
jgi:phenylalanine-4-hydroxylase